jgi:hypothetical protein
MFGSFLRGLGMFLVTTLWRQIVEVIETDSDNRGTIDPNG